ncbi:hypothetical protein H0H92_014398 [Tricholoma furcatifolium]|nr:hypothetical protein H0H92_014398 [Tricholoma furcatifolium]
MYCRTGGDDEVSTIYEYNFKIQNHPSLRSWTARIPDSTQYNLEALKTSIFRGPHYPPPLPAPPPGFKVPYAKWTTVTEVAAAQPSGSAEPPSVTTSALPEVKVEESKPVVIVKKRDPYEEDDDALLLLKSESPSLTPTSILKRESELGDEDIKREQSIKSETEHSDLADAINEYLSAIEAEEESKNTLRHPSESTAEADPPDAEVLGDENDLFAQLSAAIAEYESGRPSSGTFKAEPQDDPHGSYRNRSATLVTDLGNEGSSNIHVKAEPNDDDRLPPPEPIQRTLDPRRARSTTLQSQHREMDAIVKQEPREFSTTSAWRPGVPNTIPRHQPSVNRVGHTDTPVRDPQLARRGRHETDQGVSRSAAGGERMYIDNDRPTHATSDDVIVKSEPQEEYVSQWRPQVQTRDPRLQKRSGPVAGRLSDEIEGG